MLSDRNALIEKHQKENEALKEQKKLDKNNLYSFKNQKASARKRDTSSREEDKDDFDVALLRKTVPDEASRWPTHLLHIIHCYKPAG